MAYVITETCTKDEHCIETCPVNCIHPTKDEPNFETVPVCPTQSIYVVEELPEEQKAFIDKNAAYYN